jgi:hypothetical protein
MHICNFIITRFLGYIMFKNTGSSIDLDKWYAKLVGAMFETILCNAAEYHKIPQEMIKM